MPLTQREIDAAEAHAKTAEGYVPQGHNPVTVCGICGEESQLYVWFPSCTECGEQVCKGCMVADSDDERNRCLCKPCELQDAIIDASVVGSKAPQYRPARERAYRLTRQLVRDFIARGYREQLKASAALPPQPSRIAHDGASFIDLDQRSNYTGD